MKLTGAVEMKDKTTGEPQLHDCCWTAQALSDRTCQLHRCIQQIRTQPTDCDLLTAKWHSETALSTGTALSTAGGGRGILTPTRINSKFVSDTKFNNPPLKK